MIEQFFQVRRVIVEMRSERYAYLLGYNPDIAHGNDLKFYYYPYFMNGKMMITNLFDSMVTSTIDEFNHMQVFKKFVSNSYLKKYSQKRLE